MELSWKAGAGRQADSPSRKPQAVNDSAYRFLIAKLPRGPTVHRLFGQGFVDLPCNLKSEASFNLENEDISLET
jgi:hypothetical protein